ncbi:protein TolA [Marinomonas sp. 42_23_T18]|nr:protein TolA [Marinomonas sp. 42_23_T18]
MSFFSKESYGLPMLLALSLHLFLIVVSLVAVDFKEEQDLRVNDRPVVQAKVVDISQTIIGKKIEENKAKVKAKALAAKQKTQRDKKRKAAEQALKDRKKQLAQQKKQKQAVEKKARVAEKAARKAEADKLQKRQAAEADKQQVAAKKSQQAKADAKKRLAQESSKADKAKKLAEAKKREQAKINQQKAAQERKRLEVIRIAAEQKKRQEEAQQALVQEKARKEALAAELALQAEAERLDDIAEAQMLQSMSGLINQRIRSRWIRPPNAKNGMRTQLSIFFLPTGEVDLAQITRSSGDDLFDQRAVDAVYKMGRIEELSELDPYVFERNFRQIEIIFNPQDLRR